MKIRAYQETPENQTRGPLIAWHCFDAENGEDFGIEYTRGQTLEDVREEISNAFDLDGPRRVFLYLFDGWTKTAKYKEA